MMPWNACMSHVSAWLCVRVLVVRSCRIHVPRSCTPRQAPRACLALARRPMVDRRMAHRQTADRRTVDRRTVDHLQATPLRHPQATPLRHPQAAPLHHPPASCPSPRAHQTGLRVGPANRLRRRRLPRLSASQLPRHRRCHCHCHYQNYHPTPSPTRREAMQS